MTGATGGLGRAVVRRFAGREFRIAATYLVPDEAEPLEAEVRAPEEHLILRRVDCTDPDAVASFVDEVAGRFGPLNVLATLVGGWSGGRDVVETDDLRFDRMIDLNLRTAFNTARAALPHMREAEWGRVVMVGSRAAIEPAPGQAMYNAAKAGVIALARTIAQEVADLGITANVVLPSVVDTPTFRRSVPHADYVRWPTPEDIAAVIDFIASPESGVVNGAMIPVYGAS